MKSIKKAKLRWGKYPSPIELQIAQKLSLLSIRVDRGSGHPLGNPFLLFKEQEHLRPFVCKCYTNWLAAVLLASPDSVVSPQLFNVGLVIVARDAKPFTCGQIQEAILELFKLSQDYDLELFCWCDPLDCHVDTIIFWLKRYESQKAYWLRLDAV